MSKWPTISRKILRNESSFLLFDVGGDFFSLDEEGSSCQGLLEECLERLGVNKGGSTKTAFWEERQ